MAIDTVVTHLPLEPAAQAFADAVAKPPFITELGPEKGRETLDEVQAGQGVEKPEVVIEDFTIGGGNHREVKIRLLKPPGVSDSLPVILYLHGGGWVFGDRSTHDRLVRELVVGTSAAVVFADYRRSPEAGYPSAIEEAYASAEWIVEHGAEKGLDPARVVVAGDSVGGNMTAAVTLMAKERGGPEFRAQVLLYPVTDASFDTHSYHEFAEGYHLRRDMMQWFWDQYTTDPDERARITASPLRATTDQLTGLPPALVITGEADVLRDEGEAYGRKLREAGVDVAATRYEGVIHDFLVLDAMRDTHDARAATAQVVAYISQHLTRD
jgi:acetyl esterase/lipase